MKNVVSSTHNNHTSALHQDNNQLQQAEVLYAHFPFITEYFLKNSTQWSKFKKK